MMMIFTFLLLSPQSYIEKKWMKETLIYSNAMQKKVNELGLKSVPALLNVLLKMVDSPQSQMDNLVVFNLTSFLPQMGSENFDTLSQQNKCLLYSIVDPASHLAKDLKFNKRNRLNMFAILLMTPAIDALGNMGGDDARSALSLKLRVTTNPMIRSRIIQALKTLSPDIEISDFKDITTDDIPNNASDLFSGIAFPYSKFSIQSKSIAPIVFIYCMGAIFWYEIIAHVFINSFYSFPLGYLPIAVASLIANSIYHRDTLLAQESLFNKILRSHSSMNDILNITPVQFFRLLPGGMQLYSQLICEQVRYSDFESSLSLNPAQQNRLNKIVKLYNHSLKFPELRTLPYLLPGPLIHALGTVGNMESLRLLLQLRKLSIDPALTQIVDSSIHSLEVRLKVSSAELLRPSSLPADKLLKPAQSTEKNGHLLKLPPSSVGLSTSDAKATEDVQISQM